MKAKCRPFLFTKLPFTLGLAGVLLTVSISLPIHAAESLGFKVPDGFEVTRYADDSLAHDIFSMTIDAHGRVVVAGAGYVKILHDTNGDGRADKATLFSEIPRSGAHGMYFEGNDLICVGDNGVRRLFDRNGDGVADGEAELWLRTEKDGEHSANGIIRGPDGWYYLACGNDAGISRVHAATPGSPVNNPVAGAIVRISPDGKTSEIYAHGFRNPYDLDFNSLGNLFTYDADGERDHHLPYYSPTRIFEVAQGMAHGWILKGWQHAWNRPPSNFDNVERLVEVGRGSPTGVLVYRHRAFPERYRDGLLAICWTFGRVYFFPLTRRDSTYSSQMEIFMETTSDVGFAPVDMAVDPDGDLYVAIGGRGTIGSVFRVHYQGPLPPQSPQNDPLRQVLWADQPLSSWSRAQWVPKAWQLGKAAFENAIPNINLPMAQRLRAVEILVEVFGGITLETAHQATASDAPELMARAVWAIGRSPDSDANRQFIAAMTQEADARIARAAWEALAAVPTPLHELPRRHAWFAGFDYPDRRVRMAAVLAARGPGKQSFQKALEASRGPITPRQRLGTLMVFGPNHQEVGYWQLGYFRTCLDVFEQSADTSLRLDAVRLLQIGLGDINLTQDKADIDNGYLARATDEVDEKLRRLTTEKLSPAFPTNDAELNRELARLLAMLSAHEPDLLSRVTAACTENSSVEDDIHYLAVTSRLPAKRSSQVSERIAHSLAQLHYKMAAAKKEPSRNWPLRVSELCERLLARDSALAKTLASEPTLGLADHCLFAKLLPEPEQTAAARRLLAAAVANQSKTKTAWTPELIDLLGALPENEIFPVLRQQWNTLALQDAISLVFARRPQSADRERFVAALHSIQPGVVERAATALLTLDQRGTPVEMAAALNAMKRFSSLPKEKSLAATLSNLLASWSGQKLALPANADALAVYATWFDWFARTYSRDAIEISGANEGNLATLKHRLAVIRWEAGNSTRGQRLFEERSCQRCHAGAWRLGPELTGITVRLSRDDLFIAIVDPNRDISPTYLPKVISTRSGNTYTGVLVYDSPTAKLVQTDPDTTVRLTGEEVTDVQTGRVSMMPSGLLDGLKDDDLADLYAYVKTLGKK